LNALIFLAAMAGSCKAQTAAKSGALSPEVVRRIQSEIRSRYTVSQQVEISVSAPQPSDIPGYDKLVVTLTQNAQKTTFDFLISLDRKTLARLEKIDISQDVMSKIDLRGRPVRGSPAAKVTIVNYDDFQCPFCSRMHATLFPGLLNQYGGKVKIIYKDYPLTQIHPWAMHAAVDANCLAAQDSAAYWDFADYVHSSRREVGGDSAPAAFLNLDKAALNQGEKHHLDAQKLRACVQKSDETSVRGSMAEAEKLGVDATPTLFINGAKISGAVP